MATGTITKVIPTSGTGYCKMPDGTLICWGKKAVARNSGQNFTTDSFPVSFISEPTGFCTYMTGHPEIWLATVTDLTTTNIEMVLYNTGGTTSGNGNLYWIAIGRWKA